MKTLQEHAAESIALVDMIERAKLNAHASGKVLAIVHDPIGCAGDAFAPFGYCPLSAVPLLHSTGTVLATVYSDGAINER